MLGKLIKYEFKSTGRMLLPLYGLLLILSFLIRFSTINESNYNTDNPVMQIFSVVNTTVIPSLSWLDPRLQTMDTEELCV